MFGSFRYCEVQLETKLAYIYAVEFVNQILFGILAGLFAKSVLESF